MLEALTFSREPGIAPYLALAWIFAVSSALPLAFALRASWREPGLRKAGRYVLLTAIPSVLLFGEYAVRSFAAAPRYGYEYSSHLLVFIGNVLGVVWTYKSFQAWNVDAGVPAFQVIRGLYVLAWLLTGMVQLVLVTFV